MHWRSGTVPECQILMYHGWGFDSRCWQSWEERLGSYGAVECYDRGYFGKPAVPVISGNAEKLIVFTHSFGLHLCSKEWIQNADILVIFGGFLQFHPHAAQFKRRSRLVLQQMINEFEIRPEEVLQEFWRNCYAPADAPELSVENINHELMLKDLNRLHDSRREIALLKEPGEVYIFHGADDYIVPKSKGREIYNRLQDKARYYEIRMSGHALPFTHHVQSFEFLKHHLEKLLT